MIREKRYKFRWVEVHEAEVMAINEDKAYDLATSLDCDVTMKSREQTDAQCLTEETEPDEMERAHTEMEEKL